MATPAANSIRYNFLPSLLPAVPPNLDGEVAFVVNGSDTGTMITLGTPFTTTSFQDFVDLGVEYASDAINAALPEYRNNNLILQAKAFYDLAGEGARAHWLVLSSEMGAGQTFDTIFGGTNSSNLMAALARQSQYQIRILGVSFSLRNPDMIDDEDPDAMEGDMVDNPDVNLIRPAVTGKSFAGGLTDASVRLVDDSAGYWENNGMPFLAVVGADGVDGDPSLTFEGERNRRTSVLVGGIRLGRLLPSNITNASMYDNLTDIGAFRTKSPVGLCLGSLYRREVQQSLVNVNLGAIPILDESNAYVRGEVIRSLSPTDAAALNDGRFIYLRAYPASTGVYWATDSLATSTDTAYEVDTQQRRSVAKAAFVANGFLTRILGGDFELDNRGYLSNVEAETIEMGLNDRLGAALVETGNVSAVTARLINDRPFEPDRELNFNLSIVPRGVAKTIIVNIGRFIST